MSADPKSSRFKRLHGATIVLTGATSGIGHATALVLAPLAGRLILHGLETAERAADSLAAVKAEMRSGAELLYYPADYGVLAEVMRLADDIRAATDRIDLLVNNAGRPGAPARTLTADGNEATLQTNYLAPFLLTARLVDLIGGNSRGRIVNIASATHLEAKLLLDDLKLARHRYSPADVYARSKLALVTHSCWLATHRPNPNLDVVSMHPGVIATPLLHAMFSIGGASPQRAAAAILDVASRDGDNGTYYDEHEPAPSNPFASDPAVQDRLYEETLKLLGERVAPHVFDQRETP